MSWMAWTWPTAAFFVIIAATLAFFTVLAIRYPETPRRGILRMETTRGDRLFIGLLSMAFINLAWLGLTDITQWAGLAISLLFLAVVFKTV
ncbi:DUF2160 domain-containing protein [Fulvimarina sp. MAC8]|uniref:DUF2160 domain-containing protein n=1 Tax=Fulvimarina sp. MAC8 TaxID=3162874 RepID=UPI0032EE8948